ncbi:acyl-CoA dehydrogenase [Nonomuraea sp. NPDC050310]|uniref:acyl-CoA dehydrogenase n=1 Tax=Nonomuraea sp. NPDC050310 TaxID=3154935 RepID=UPI0033CA5D4F
MGIGLTDEHRALAASAAGSARKGDLLRPEWTGLHVPEEFGGQGFGLLELCVALEAVGEDLDSGPFLATALVSAVLTRTAEPARWAAQLGGLAGGTLTAAAGLLPGRALGSPDADLFLLPTPNGWALLDRPDAATSDRAENGLDLDRPFFAAVPLAVPAERLVGEAPVKELAAVLLGAEACGVAAWAVRTATGHAKVREQFGRPIGQFKGVKHRVAAAFVALEQARAAVWDAARAWDEGDTPQTRLATAVAAVLAPDAAVGCCADAIQVLGGLGYTFEHPAHRYYRRALTTRRLTAGPWAEQALDLALSGVRRSMDPDLPPEAEPLREELAGIAAELRAAEPLDRLARFARDGWIMPHLPRPWGRAATPLEQVIIHQEFPKRPNLGIAAWAVPSIVRYGTPEQQDRFLPRTFTGELVWCQLFSEPGAGSDLAGLSTRAVRVEGGWSLTGQKVWTSLAQYAHWGICLARTSPDRPKHEGLTYFLVDMADPGVTVRPLREINGEEIFNEVFLDDVFVPDDLVVGEVDQGWRVARDTLSHERVALGDSWGPGARHTDLARLLAELPGTRQADRERAGRLWAEGQATSALGLRVTLSQLAGADPGPASSVRKLLGMRHFQAVAEFCWSLAPDDPHWSRMILATRAFTIGGGTTEIQLNIIAERALGLPRDP